MEPQVCSRSSSDVVTLRDQIHRLQLQVDLLTIQNSKLQQQVDNLLAGKADVTINWAQVHAAMASFIEFRDPESQEQLTRHYSYLQGGQETAKLLQAQPHQAASMLVMEEWSLASKLQVPSAAEKLARKYHV